MSDRAAKPSAHPTRVLGDTRVDQPTTKDASGPACLVFIAGERVGHKVPLRPGRMEVGREPTCEVSLVSDLVSRIHARLIISDTQAFLVDLGSTNGTFVNDRPIRDRMLQDGDRISFGDVVVKYLTQGNAETAYHDEVFRLVSHDGLTEVYNRRYFDEQLTQKLQQGLGLGLLLLDADHFKRINDTYGHGGGDAVLRALARRVAGLLPSSAFVARFGGEEFAVLLTGAADANLSDPGVLLAERVRTEIQANPVDFGQHRIPVTVSVGVAWTAPGSPEPYSSESLLRIADERLYAAKQGGRNRVCDGTALSNRPILNRPTPKPAK